MMIGKSCRDVAQLVSRSRDRRLTRRERFGVRMHLLFCVYCRRYARQLHWLENALARVRTDSKAANLDEAARERIRRGLHDHCDDGG